MNIEEIVPELFGSEKRIYYCQRCLNHGLRFKRKNHKTECAFRFCPCSDCEMISRRRELNSRLRMDAGDEKADSTPLSLVLPFPDISPPPSSEETTKTKERRPNCQRCAQHNTQNRLKGHKRNCPYKDCGCAKCQVVVERQRLMADQIKLRRKQKKEKQLLAECPSPSESTHSEGGAPLCEKCTQQALSYQQLMTAFDPSIQIDPLNTLAHLLLVCPHRMTC